MKNHFLLLASILCYQMALTQTVKFEWAHRTGGIEYDHSRSIATDSFGHVYVLGEYEDTVDMDPGVDTQLFVPVLHTDIFLQKLDSNGHLIWAKSIGARGGEVGDDIATDQDGNVYICGSFAYTMDFDPGPDSAIVDPVGHIDIFILKLDSAGEFQWVRTTGGVRHDRPYSIALDSNKNVYTTGFFNDTVDFDPGKDTFFLMAGPELFKPGATHVYVQKLDSQGNFVWAKSIGGDQRIRSYDIAVSPGGNAYITGSFSGKVDFDPGPGVLEISVEDNSSEGSDDIYVLKLNQDGTLGWVAPTGGKRHDQGSVIAIDNDENVYTSGIYYDRVDFDPGADNLFFTANGSYDAFIQKHDSTGKFQWARSIGGAWYDGVAGLQLDKASNVYAAGFFYEEVDFDPGSGSYVLKSKGSGDLFVLKLSRQGEFVWVKAMGGKEFSGAMAMDMDTRRNIYVTGHFLETSNFDPDGTKLLTSAGLRDIFSLRLSQCRPKVRKSSINACGTYTWIDGTTYNKSTKATWYPLPTARSCDSVLILDLDITEIDTGVSQNGFELRAIQAGAKYQWLDCNNAFSALEGEDKYSLMVKKNGSYAVEVSLNGCSDTSACFEFTTVGDKEQTSLSGVNIYPNPTQGYININLGTSQGTLLRAFNAQGKLILERQLSGNSEQLVDLRHGAGLYYIELSREGHSQGYKVLVE